MRSSFGLSKAAVLRHQSTSSSRGNLAEVEDDQLARKTAEMKAQMIQQGYHGPSLWTQVICWGDHDQVSIYKIGVYVYLI